MIEIIGYIFVTIGVIFDFFGALALLAGVKMLTGV